MVVALQTRQLINTIKLFPMLLPPLSAPCPPCQRDAAVRVEMLERDRTKVQGYQQFLCVPGARLGHGAANPCVDGAVY